MISEVDQRGVEEKEVEVGYKRPGTLPGSWDSPVGEYFTVRREGSAVAVEKLLPEVTEWKHGHPSKGILRIPKNAIWVEERYPKRWKMKALYDVLQEGGVREVYGETFIIRGYLKEKGFRWNPERKRWISG